MWQEERYISYKTTQVAKISVDPNFVELTADVLQIFYKISYIFFWVHMMLYIPYRPDQGQYICCV